ncbi:sortase B [Lachnospiraceae bacterium PF1-21]|uniref:Class B sortase n=1 Tax=Ohessyouella blattaphilus TaxID=2949333 RepID=A0ABT1ELB4_9FIRM|nr:class B sortase [Ohessyouella blattaphilus]MCP1111485.1 class B sortase [Ohessyouella blattaphilus]MCR8564879.1 class B sortase [Ohessyouella blattaphilus]
MASDNNNQRISRIITLMHFLLDNLLLICFVLVLLCSLYVLHGNKQVITNADASQYVQYKPEDAKSFAQLVEINAEVFGWLNVYGTGIDYPITQSDNNQKYINTNAYNKPSMAGCIYLDYRNSQDFTDFNSILYGHHMAESAMFGDIELFDDKDFFETHNYGELYTSTTETYYGIEFFAYILGDAYDWSLYNPSITDNKQEYIGYLYSISKYSRMLDNLGDSSLIILSTCASEPTNGRHLLVGRLSSERFENPYPADNTTEKSNKMPEALTSEWAPIIICILTICLSLLIAGKSKKSRGKKGGDD